MFAGYFWERNFLLPQQDIHKRILNAAYIEHGSIPNKEIWNLIRFHTPEGIIFYPRN